MRMLVLALAARALVAQAGGAEEQVSLGLQAFQHARFAEAVQHFSDAVRLDPGYLDAHVYLATAYLQQYVPGLNAPENERMAQRAIDEFQQVLVLDPENDAALASIASLYLSRKKFEDAREWYEKLTSLAPDNKQAWYTLGVIAWRQFYPAYGEARAQAGLKPADPGPLPGGAARAEMKSRWGAVVAGGIENLRRALSLDPDYDDAMAYLNLLLRERADWAESAAEYQAEIEAADGWVHRALDIKRRKAEWRSPQP